MQVTEFHRGLSRRLGFNLEHTPREVPHTGRPPQLRIALPGRTSEHCYTRTCITLIATAHARIARQFGSRGNMAQPRSSLIQVLRSRGEEGQELASAIESRVRPAAERLMPDAQKLFPY